MLLSLPRKGKADFNFSSDADEEDSDEEEEDFLRRELAHLESLEDLLEELGGDMMAEDDDEIWDESTLEELLDILPKDDEDGDEDDDDGDNDDDEDNSQQSNDLMRQSAAAQLEQALLQGVVPVSAGVGDDQLPGDYGFDPLNLSTKDYFRSTQFFLLKLFPNGGDDPSPPSPRPRALILRDYREAEIRHGRLAMLAAVFWPLQEMLDEFLLEEDLFGPLLYGPVTLPYFPLLMTAIMLLLGYLDIYSQAIKDRDKIGEAFLPADCFWDPLQIVEGAPDLMKRNMQERELLVRIETIDAAVGSDLSHDLFSVLLFQNGRMAMVGFAAYLWEEGITRTPLVHIPGNELLLRPAYQVPFIQEWLDAQFMSASIGGGYL
jgi:hypothetical protein